MEPTTTARRHTRRRIDEYLVDAAGRGLRAHRRQRLDHRQVRPLAGDLGRRHPRRPGPAVRAVRSSRRGDRTSRSSRWRRRRSSGCRRAAAAAVPARTSSTSSASEEERVLEGYGWVNKEAGIVRIPIEEAMRLTVERGLPSRRRPDGAAARNARPDAVGLERRADDGAKTGNEPGDPRASGASRLAVPCALCIRPWLRRRGAAQPGLPAARWRFADRAVVAVKRPPQLKDVTFAQRLNEQLPLDATFKDETGRARHARRLLRREAGRAGVRLLPVPDALHADDERHRRALKVLPFDAGQGLRRRPRQLRPARHAGQRRGARSGRTSSTGRSARTPRPAGIF